MRHRERAGEVRDDVLRALEADGESQEPRVGPGLGCDRSVGQGGRMLDEGVDTAE